MAETNTDERGPGTIHFRFHWLLDELEKRSLIPSSGFDSSVAPEREAIAAIDVLQTENKRLRDALADMLRQISNARESLTRRDERDEARHDVERGAWMAFI